MLRFIHTRGLRECLERYREAGEQLGFVPTMGALHEGHLDLVRRAREICDRVVVSIFVNPTQFNDAGDLAAYPRTLEADVEMLCAEAVDVVFHPDVDDVYPPGEDLGRRQFDFGGLDELMEGAFRPGHFAGVAQVVDRFLHIVAPDRLFMGQKDYQQVAIIRSMLEQTAHRAELVVVPTRREPHGLAMSSRNERLSPADREKAAAIFEALSWMRSQAMVSSVEDLRRDFLERCSIPPLRTEYIEVVDGQRLRPLSNLSQSDVVVACAAVWAGEVRLIDNMTLVGDELSS